MIDSRLFSLRRSKVTVSTVGIVPRILQARRAPVSACSVPSHELLSALQTAGSLRKCDLHGQLLFLSYQSLSSLHVLHWQCRRISGGAPRPMTSLTAQLVEDLPGVSLALSLHAPNQELRASIVPSARAYKLDKLMAAVDTYSERTGQKV